MNNLGKLIKMMKKEKIISGIERCSYCGSRAVVRRKKFYFVECRHCLVGAINAWNALNERSNPK